MVRNKKFPKLQGPFVRWVSPIAFTVMIDGQEILAHKDYWEGDIPPYEPAGETDVKSDG